MTEPNNAEPVVEDEDGHTDPCMPLDAEALDGGFMEEAARPWHPAKSLLALKAAIDAAYPGARRRATASSGMPRTSRARPTTILG